MQFKDHGRLMHRFGVLVGYHSKEASTWPMKDARDGDTRVTDLDEVLTYRCLLMIMLFRTAVDTTRLLPMMDSELWDKIVPML